MELPTTLTVGQLRAALYDLDDNTPVYLAMQPSWPLQHAVANVVKTRPVNCAYMDGSDPHGEHDHSMCEDVVSEHVEQGDPEFLPAVYIADGGQLQYLPVDAREALGWS